MWPFNKKPKTLSFEQLYEISIPGVIQLAEDPNNTFHLLKKVDGQLDEWLSYMEDKLKQVARLDSLEAQALALRKIVITALGSRFNFQPFVSATLSNEDKYVIANTLLKDISGSDVGKKIQQGILQFAWSEAIVIGTFEVCKHLEGDGAVEWFKTYAGAKQSEIDNLITGLLEKEKEGEISLLTRQLLTTAQNALEEIENNILVR